MSSGIPLPPCGHEWAETTEWCRVRCPQVAPPAATTTEATEHRADAPHMGPRMGKEQRFSDRFLSKKKPPYPPSGCSHGRARSHSGLMEIRR